MYKTVRKGDASLQYTILPQTDQCPSAGFPQVSSTKPRPRIIKYTMAVLMVLIILSCIATPFLMNQNDHNLFASTVFAIGRVGHNSSPPRNASTRNQAQDIAIGKARSRITIATLSTTEAARKKEHQDLAPTPTGISREDAARELTSPETPFSTTQRPDESAEVSTKSRQMSTSSTSAPTSTGVPTPSTLRTTTASRGFEGQRVKSTSSPPWNSKMRVTLKLTENQTIPQKYVNTGMASYKKGNITTSVVAHNLSLEGLVIKTPEGTIKPWYLTDPASEYQWKGTAQMPLTIYVVLTGLACMAIVSILLTLYVQRKASRRQRQSVEEPESGNQEEDTSTLLGGESQETEEKE